MCFKDVLTHLHAAGLPVTKVQVRWAIDSGKVAKPPLDGSLRFDFREQHLEQLKDYFRAVAVSRNGVAGGKAGKAKTAKVSRKAGAAKKAK